jgi:hypothetical protein
VYGTPTIVLRDPLLHSLFEGAIVEIDDARPETVRLALRKITRDPDFRKQLRENIDRNYEKRFRMYQDEVSKLRQVLATSN